MDYVSKVLIFTQHHTPFEFSGQVAQRIYEVTRNTCRSEERPNLFYPNASGEKIFIPGNQIAGMGFTEHPQQDQLAELDHQINELWAKVENATGRKSHAFISWEYEGDSTFVIDRMSQIKKRVSNDSAIADLLRQIEKLEDKKGQVLDGVGDEHEIETQK